jgi:hypothetical protein
MLPLLICPLPFWAFFVSLFLFPLTQGLTELANYSGFIIPRPELQGIRPWLVVTLPALMPGLQHIAVPLFFDLRFFLWHGLMFALFASFC